ncbi:MAG TPA: DUF1697 domain-containing protein [Candidatus Saccharimonadales bacterium]|nr:DUF1697 domain-containing protein [Candidatus Saccharimonadales bacterium]
MIYAALLRGINVGGTGKVEMAKLKVTFERLGLSAVKTYINSGNVIFLTESRDQQQLTAQIEAAIEHDFGFSVKVLLRNIDQVEKLVEAIPNSWVNDTNMKCDVLFLWPEIDDPNIVEQLPNDPEIEDVKYFPGAVVWRIDRGKVIESKMVKLVGTKLHKQMTARNSNTVCKIYDLMLALKSA